jgi:hypothetical protein
VRNDDKLKLESRAEWYAMVENRPAHWRGIKHNVRANFNREEWGGQNELKLWLYITQTTIIVTGKVQDQFTVYGPDLHTLPEMRLTSTHPRLHTKLIQEDKMLVYLMYNGVHYNPIIYDSTPPLSLSENMPEWDPPPSSQEEKRQESKVSWQT